MGQYLIEIKAVGGHGCQRELKDGEIVGECANDACPDCQTRALVKDLRANGSSIESAALTHWPGTESEVKDDLLTGKRTGSF